VHRIIPEVNGRGRRLDFLGGRLNFSAQLVFPFLKEKIYFLGQRYELLLVRLDGGEFAKLTPFFFIIVAHVKN
jgi:hypothetical protein